MTTVAEQKREPIRDPKRLRALAHPLRWRLLEVIGNEDTATATRCAELLGESVASCSYHLKMLAKYDYIEEVPSEGREKPWKLTRRDQTFDHEGLSLEGQLAAEAAGEAFMEFEFSALRERVRAHSMQSAEWRKAARLMATTLYLTAAELEEIGEKVAELMETHMERWDDPAARPEGARQVRIFASMFPNSERS